MGTGVSALGNGQDVDEKLLKEEHIDEALGFYRKWSMDEVKHIMNLLVETQELKVIAQEQSEQAASRPSYHVNIVAPETIRKAFAIRVPWSEFYELVYDTDEFR